MRRAISHGSRASLLPAPRIPVPRLVAPAAAFLSLFYLTSFERAGP